jgi:hypothetical protein
VRVVAPLRDGLMIDPLLLGAFVARVAATAGLTLAYIFFTAVIWSK